MKQLYNLGILFFGLMLKTASFFNLKAKKWVLGRKNWKTNALKNASKIRNAFWFHCASLGEFEQGRPLLEALKIKYPETPIVLTFFSPSGFEMRKNYREADYICYLPLDTPSNAQFFVNTIRPKAAFFIKYEFWLNFLLELKNQNIPAFNISGNFRPEQRFFTKKNPFYRESLLCFSHFFVQNQQSRDLLSSIGLENVTVSGDTRYDRVAANAVQAKSSQVLLDFKEKEPLLIVGSSWAVDHQMIVPKINDGTIQEKVIIAPHEINEKSNNTILEQLAVKAFRYSCNDEVVSFSQKRVAVLDCMGFLANAYILGSYAYVGGAFGKGLHNILEPAVFGLPVIFGPYFAKFPEAQEFIDAGIGFSVKNQDEFLNTRTFILENLPELQTKVKAFMVSKTGATDLIMRQLDF